MLLQVERFYVENGMKFLTVKTLDGSVEFEPYARTRKFYQTMGFLPLEVFLMIGTKKIPVCFKQNTSGLR